MIHLVVSEVSGCVGFAGDYFKLQKVSGVEGSQRALPLTTYVHTGLGSAHKDNTPTVFDSVAQS